MIKKIVANSLILSSAALSIHAYALEIVGTKEAKALSSQARPGLNAFVEKPVFLMKVKLSKQEFAALTKPQHASQNLALANSPLSTQGKLNFEKFPVLDQGSHSSCVTFASATALNYVLGQPDHVSSLCSLSLGKTLESNGYYPSGWDGSLGPIVLDQFMRFGYVTTADQTKYGCAGLKEYPLINEYDQGKAMPLTAYKRYSKSLLAEPISTYKDYVVSWKPLLSAEDAFSNDGNDYVDHALIEVKKTFLSNSNNTKTIVTIGTLLYGDICHVGACAKYKRQNDTWAMSDEINNELQNKVSPDAGHEIVIIAYNDNAIAVDKNGKTHKGLFTIRNTWGNQVGDKGNYYMTYDYFKTFVIEVQKISRVIEMHE